MESSTGLNSIFELYDDYYQNLYIWDDRLVQGKTYTLRMNGYYSADGVWEEEGERRSQLHTYKLPALHALARDVPLPEVAQRQCEQ